MAKNDWDVTILEKNETVGGRARELKIDGFTFDMGPSWYWMPDVFEWFFKNFDKQVSDYYDLIRLDPSYEVFWPTTRQEVPGVYENLKSSFENIEPGAADRLDAFMKEAAYKYEVGMQKLVHKPGQTVTEFLDKDVMLGVLRLDVFTNMKKHVAKYFKDARLQQLMEFPVLFLGALPQKIPALYSLMNYADAKLGTWYPMGGMVQIVKGMETLALSLGVQIVTGANVQSIEVSKGKATAVTCTHNGVSAQYPADAVVGNADYAFIEQNLLQPKYQTYTEDYWSKKTFAPSCLLYYVGISKKLNNVQHHALFFDTDFEQHGKEIYEQPGWPSAPLFYVSCTSVTDAATAPQGCENLFFLIPVAPGLGGDDESLRKKYFNMIVQRFEEKTGNKISEHIVVYQSYSLSNFVTDYNAYKGNAYGLANTLLQTAILKPSIKSKKVKNLYYTGQLTVPGPGVPPALISGKVVSDVIKKDFA